eukprot:14572953-Ditylum_brightwellii.AAC.1
MTKDPISCLGLSWALKKQSPPSLGHINTTQQKQAGPFGEDFSKIPSQPYPLILAPTNTGNSPHLLAIGSPPHPTSTMTTTYHHPPDSCMHSPTVASSYMK